MELRIYMDLEGRPGSGKSTALLAIKDVLQAAGFEIRTPMGWPPIGKQGAPGNLKESIILVRHI